MDRNWIRPRAGANVSAGRCAGCITTPSRIHAVKMFGISCNRSFRNLKETFRSWHESIMWGAPTFVSRRILLIGCCSYLSGMERDLFLYRTWISSQHFSPLCRLPLRRRLIHPGTSRTSRNFPYSNGAPVL